MTEFTSWVIVGTITAFSALAIALVALLLFGPFIILIWAVLSTM